MELDWYEEIEETPLELKIKSKASDVWSAVGYDATIPQIEECCKVYMITYEQAMMWKDWCIRKDEISKENKKRAEEERKKYLEEKRKYHEQRNKEASK